MSMKRGNGIVIVGFLLLSCTVEDNSADSLDVLFDNPNLPSIVEENAPPL